MLRLAIDRINKPQLLRQQLQRPGQRLVFGQQHGVIRVKQNRATYRLHVQPELMGFAGMGRQGK